MSLGTEILSILQNLSVFDLFSAVAVLFFALTVLLHQDNTR